jgi:pimeloyl-ACP methyl ester carboxylesterase
MTAALQDCDRTDAWNDWRRIQCPTLVVHAERGLHQATAARMASVLPFATVAVVAGASHDLHLENAEGWRAAIEPFLLNLVRSG